MSDKEDKALLDQRTASDSETEQILLDKLKSWLESGITTSYLATTDLQRLLEVATSAETKAWCYLILGQITENRNQYDAAIDYYTRGITFRTTAKNVKYLLHNNTGYCLNVQGMHRAAEGYCRLAIDIDPQRHNAYKNLGVSLAGQNKIVDAAGAYIHATRADPTDMRALYLLQELLKDHPDMASQFPEILKDAEQCRELVGAVQRNVVPKSSSCEIGRLKFVPGAGFLQSRDGVETEISEDEIVQRYGHKALWQVRQFAGKWIAILSVDESNMQENVVAGDDLKDVSMSLTFPVSSSRVKPSNHQRFNEQENDEAIESIRELLTEIQTQNKQRKWRVLFDVQLGILGLLVSAVILSGIWVSIANRVGYNFGLNLIESIRGHLASDIAIIAFVAFGILLWVTAVFCRDWFPADRSPILRRWFKYLGRTVVILLVAYAIYPSVETYLPEPASRITWVLWHRSESRPQSGISKSMSAWKQDSYFDTHKECIAEINRRVENEKRFAQSRRKNFIADVIANKEMPRVVVEWESPDKSKATIRYTDGSHNFTQSFACGRMLLVNRSG